MGENIWHLISGLVAIETFPVCVGVVIGVGAVPMTHGKMDTVLTRVTPQKENIKYIVMPTPDMAQKKKMSKFLY